MSNAARVQAARRDVAPACDCDRAAQPQLVPVEQALDEILASAKPVLGSEAVPVVQARGCIVSASIASAVPLPRFDNSAMDGYAIHGADLSAGQPIRLKLVDRISAGHSKAAELRAGTTVQVLTGAPVPSGAAAVVPHEQTRRAGNEVVIDAPVSFGANIRRAGEDVAASQPLICTGTRIDARHVALLLAAGIVEISVKPRLRVGLLSSGDELVAPGGSVGEHKIVDTNRPLLAGLLESPDLELRDCGIVPDRLDAITEKVRQTARDCDLLVTTGGICGSDADHMAPAIRAAGGECKQIKLALRPGKPIGVGRIGTTQVLCLPGNPVSVLVTSVLFVRPLLLALSGAPRRSPHGIAAVAADLFHHVPGRVEFVPVMVEAIDATGRRQLRSLPRGSHRLSSLAAADGFAEISRYSGDVRAGERLTFHPFNANWRL